jgi:hypothetical protein
MNHNLIIWIVYLSLMLFGLFTFIIATFKFNKETRGVQDD